MKILEEIYKVIATQQFCGRSTQVQAQDEDAVEAFAGLYGMLKLLPKLSKDQVLFGLDKDDKLTCQGDVAKELLALVQGKPDFVKTLFSDADFDPRLEHFWHRWTFILPEHRKQKPSSPYDPYATALSIATKQMEELNRFGPLMASELTNPALKLAVRKRENFYRSRFDRLFSQLCTFERLHRHIKWAGFAFWVDMGKDKYKDESSVLLRVKWACETLRCAVLTVEKCELQCLLIRPVWQRDGWLRLDVAWAMPKRDDRYPNEDESRVVAICGQTTSHAMLGIVSPKPDLENETYRIHSSDLDLGPTEALRRLALYYAMGDLPCSRFKLDTDELFCVGHAPRTPPRRRKEVNAPQVNHAPEVLNPFGGEFPFPRK